MTKKQFKLKKTEVKKEYRAVCLEKNGHWNSTWKDTYLEAFEEAEKHRKNVSNGLPHDIRIREKIYLEAKLT